MSGDSIAANIAEWTETNAQHTDANAQRAWDHEGILWGVFVTALFYGTPILFTLNLARQRSQTLAHVIAFNPLTPVFELARRWIIDPKGPLPGSAAAGGTTSFVVSVVIFVVVCALGVWTFRREAPRIAEQL